MHYRLGILVFIASLTAFVAHAEYHLGKNDIYKEINKEFVELGMENVELEIFGGKTEYDFEQANDVKIMLSNLKTDEEQGRFSVNAEIFADGKAVDKTKLVGRYYQIVEVWVPVKDIAKEKVINEGDLHLVKMRSGRLKNGAVAAKEDIVGKQAAKLLKADKPVDKNDLQAEIIIKRGQMVTVVYNKKGMQITSKMQALENASAGQAVKLLNLTSKKEIVAVAKESGLAEINNE